MIFVIDIQKRLNICFGNAIMSDRFGLNFILHNNCIANNHPFNIGYQQISFGLTNAANNNLLNCIIFTAKYFIFKNKLSETIPSIESFLLYVQKTKQIERFIAINKNKLRTHEIKWEQM